MDEQYIQDDRITFPGGKQKEFIERIQNKLNAPIDYLAQIIKMHPRTLRDWRREKFSASMQAIKKLSEIARVPIPQNTKIRSRYWYVQKGASLGGKTLIQKYGRVPVNPRYRKKKWYAWWNTKGKYRLNSITQPLTCKTPPQSEELAEFIGIMLGDGGMTLNQVKVTLHHIDDLEYSEFVARLMNRLFRIRPAVYHTPKYSTNHIVISRKRLVDYLCLRGLVTGNKVEQQCDIPSWIKMDEKFMISCLRGLIDTDGSVIMHRYKVSGKEYQYKKLGFTSASEPLRKSVIYAFKQLKFNPAISKRNIRLENTDEVGRYFKIIGSHNPKHLKKYRSSATMQ